MSSRPTIGGRRKRGHAGQAAELAEEQDQGIWFRLRREPDTEQFLRLTKDENEMRVDKTS